jgi:hypothetical protein
VLTVRRVYLGAVSAIGLGMLLGGLIVLLGTLAEVALGGAVFGPQLRDAISTSTAIAAVGLVGWTLHWAAAQSQAARHPEERAAVLRRLYLYAVAFVLIITLGIVGSSLSAKLLAGADGTPIDRVGAATDALRLVLLSGLWLYHLRVIEADRAAAGESGASATLRRWYAYGVQLVALTVALFATRDLVSLFFDLPGRIGRVSIAEDSGQALVWLGIWLWHVGWADRADLVRVDRASTLRAVEAFLVLLLAVALVLFEANNTLYYLVARVLGVEAPGGFRSLDLASFARPLSTVIVFGSAWALMRHRIAHDALSSEPERQAGVRRLYNHVVALAAIAALATGLAGLLWNALDVIFGAIRPQPGGAADQISMFLSLVLVSAPVWVLHWRPRPGSGLEPSSLSRRLYLFLTVAGCVVALLISGVGFVAVLFNGLLAGDLGTLANRLSGHFAVLAVGGLVGAYHWQVLLRDGRARAAAVPLPDDSAARVARIEAPGLTVTVLGASEDDVRGALASLPAGATYSIDRPTP